MNARVTPTKRMKLSLGCSLIQDMVQRVNGKHKKQRGKGDPLTKPMSMLDQVLSNLTEQNSGTRLGGESRDPSPVVALEAMVTQHVYKIVPPNGI